MYNAMESSVVHFEVGGHWTLDRLCNARRYFPGAECRVFRRKQMDKQYTIVSYILAEQCGQQHGVLLVLHRTRWTRESEEVVTHRLPTTAASYNLRLRIIISTII